MGFRTGFVFRFDALLDYRWGVGVWGVLAGSTGFKYLLCTYSSQGSAYQIGEIGSW